MTSATRQNEEKILDLTVKVLLGMPNTPSLQLCYEDDYEPALHVTPDTPMDIIAEHAFACDMATLRRGSQWVLFIWGNGEEGLTCISDYTVSLEEALKPVDAWIDEQSA